MSKEMEKQVWAWVDNVVIGLNLCPFAVKPRKRHQIGLRISDATEPADLLEDIMMEFFKLEQSDPEQLDTSLVIVSNMLDDFAEYNNFIDWLELMIEQQGWRGVFQVATFHPHYRFADTQAEDPQNLTNCAPYPIFHLLRETSIERVLASTPKPETIPINNIAQVRSLTYAQKQELFPYLFKQ
ncbi:DUF1415 domain-containing protein [Vibrio sp. WXL103]|uniref:DUF1415 domain-containing protein n=1 Tax=unclassified Vibrio TaxID=2614977 RepID=UPI003EC83858